MMVLTTGTGSRSRAAAWRASHAATAGGRACALGCHGMFHAPGAHWGGVVMAFEIKAFSPGIVLSDTEENRALLHYMKVSNAEYAARQMVESPFWGEPRSYSHWGFVGPVFPQSSKPQSCSHWGMH